MLDKAIKKYGKNSFRKEVIFMAFDPESLVWAEKQLVDQEWVERNDTYNLITGGTGFPSDNSHYMKNPFNALKHSLKIKGRCYRTKESYMIGAEKNRGRTLTQEQRKRISDKTKGELNPNFGKPRCESTKIKISEALKGKPKSDNHKNKISDALKGKCRPKSPLHRDNLSLAGYRTIEQGNHPSLIKVGCIHCRKIVSITVFNKHLKAQHETIS